MQQQIEELKNRVSETADTSDWKTYRNEDYGFSIKYPENWEESIVMDYEKVSSLGREGVLSSANIDFYKDSVNKIGFDII